uniref:Uncharacterized protein n=1 Tax=Arundo donax TaxID=35708 RepID=A0A0A9A434_ARUDO
MWMQSVTSPKIYMQFEDRRIFMEHPLLYEARALFSLC